MEQHSSDWGFVIAGANFVLAITFLCFGVSLIRLARTHPPRERRNRFRHTLGSWLLALGVFFMWIMLAWATVLGFSEPIQAVMLWICAILGVAAFFAWRATSDWTEE